MERFCFLRSALPVADWESWQWQARESKLANKFTAFEHVDANKYTHTLRGREVIFVVVLV